VSVGLSDSLDADALNRTEEPRWLRALAFGTAAAVVSFGAVGLAAAVAGVYRSYLVFPLGLALWVGLLALARPLLVERGAAGRDARIVSVAAVLFAGAMSLWGIRHASQHVLINRDGGAYTNAGRWIALHGNLRVVAAVGPFAHQPGVTFGSFAMYPNKSGTLSFQFAHLLPALLAEAHGLGGDRLMFAATPLISGAALLAFFVAAWRLLRNPYVALAALVSFAFLLPELSFSRDSYSEIPMQLMLFTALWILTDLDAFVRPRVTFVAGVLLGMLQAARIDALVSLMGVGLLFALMWLRADGHDRRRVAVGAGACAVGLVPGVVLGVTDVTLRSNQYLRDLKGNVKLLVALMVASIVFALIVVAVVPPIARRVRHIAPWVEWISAAVVAAIGFGLWVVRPVLQHVHGAANPLVGGLERAANVTVDPTRNYAEHSMVWLSWYAGPIALAAALIAGALLVRALVRGRMWFAVTGIALLAPSSAVYLWKPNISTDQIWVMRRYLFSALPLVTLLAFGLVAALLRFAPAGIPRFVPIGAAVLIGAVAVAYPISTVEPVRNIAEQRGDLLAVRDACHIMGNDAAIVVLQGPTGLLFQWAPQTLRGWCNAPVAVMPLAIPDRGVLLAKLGASWKKAGRTLWVIADAPAVIRAAIPSATLRAAPTVINPYLLERTLVRRPSHYMAEQLSLVMAAVP
jgi:hypothetical protein